MAQDFVSVANPDFLSRGKQGGKIKKMTKRQNGPNCFGLASYITAPAQLILGVNSLLHKWGTRRFNTADNSRNGPWWIGLITLGDGYHNNHHRQPSAARHGFYPGETDLTYQFIRLLAFVGLVWDVKEVPEEILAEGLLAAHENKES